MSNKTDNENPANPTLPGECELCGRETTGLKPLCDECAPQRGADARLAGNDSIRTGRQDEAVRSRDRAGADLPRLCPAGRAAVVGGEAKMAHLKGGDTLTAREYLERLREMDREIDVLIAERNSILDDHIRLTVDPSDAKVSNSNQDGPVVSVVIRMSEAEKRIDEKIDKFFEAKEAAKVLIERLEDMRYRNVLKYRYICGMQWSEIAKKMNYERANLWVLHCAALDEFGDV